MSVSSDVVGKNGTASGSAPERLRAAPQQAYTDEELFAEEQRLIFDREWVLIGRGGTMPEAGDYITARVGKRPVVAIRQKDGSLRAFANFCLHRYARLLDGRGHVGRIVCPYHAWTYDISGALVGITDRDGFCDVDKRDLALEELACQEWQGFVFVARAGDLAPVSERLAALGEHLRRYGLEHYEDRHAVDNEIWQANWKLVFENFVECYHVTYAHKQSIGPTNPTKLAELGPRDQEHFSIHHNPYRVEDYPQVHNEALDADERRQLHVIGIYPNGLMAVDPNFLWWMMLEPLGIDRTNARWGLAFSPDAMRGMADAEGFVEKIREVIRIATDEDKEVVARVQDGVGFATEERGYLHNRLEIYVDEFRQYVERTMGAG